MVDLLDLVQFLLGGLTTGCIYALVAIGFVLCANVSGVVNFAQGEYVAYGSLVTASFAVLGFPLLPAVVIAIAVGGGLGFLQERLSHAPVRNTPDFIKITITLGVSVALRGLALIIWGKDPIGVPSFTDGVLFAYGVVVPWQNLWVWGATAVLLICVFSFLKYSRAGRAVRACSINPDAARLMGISTSRTTVLVFSAAGAIGALGGAVIGPIALGSWDAGLDYGLKGFIGAIIGGFRSPGLAVVGGLGIGLVEALASGYVSSGSKDAIAYGVLLAYLLAQGGVFAFGRAAYARGERL